MTDIYALKHRHLTKDVNFIKKLEQKQKQFERLSCHRTSQNSRFKAHPNLLHSDSDTPASASCTPRVTTTFSASTTTLVYPKPSGSFRETKLRAANYHRLLHEKLSIIDGNPSHLSDFTGTGDCMPHRSDRSSTSLGSCSLDSVYGDFTDSRCHSLAPKKPLEKTSNKPNSAAEKKSNASRLSSQQSFAPKGIPISVFERKVKVVVTKSLQNITEIKSIMAQGIEPPDGEEEEAKRVVRAKEFSNRFSRNYLYPLGRQLQDFNSPTLTQLNPLIVNQKLLSAYQIIQTALQAYQHYLPSSHGDCTFTQLKILMNHILGICDIHRMQLKDQEDSYLVEFVDSYKINAELVIQKVDEMLTLPKSDKKLEASKSEQSKCVAGKQLTKRLKGSKSKLSMYTTTASFRKDAAWKRAVDCLAKKRFNVKSKYRTAAFKHRPPMQKETDNNLAISRLKNLFPEKSGASRATRLNSPVNEDTIKTMVEAQMNGDTLMIQKEEWEKMEKKNGGKCCGAEVHSNKEDLLIKLLQFTLKSHQDDDEPPKGEKITEIVNLIKNESNEDFLKKIIDGLSTPAAKPAEGQELTLQIVKSQVNISEESREGSKKSARREWKICRSPMGTPWLFCAFRKRIQKTS
ncbi:uncharacterized protein LOC126746865 isoform X2 [Anthonomus grandis grandis]|uniref:uncharacterized protein LOC126746865 isoform X2 n=1 Tax=Anthonomus grandis grandis TaxID=2921223 RepID=UPI00216586B4|nr:uncharacterized protein LOC126746865 isoform X2 [Anthonomus grandis grandis]